MAVPVTACMVPRCWRTRAPGTETCYAHVPRATDVEAEAERRRVAEYQALRELWESTHRFVREADRELAATAEFRRRYAHLGGI